MCTAEIKSLDCFDQSVPLKGIHGDHLNNLLDLSSDMKDLLQSNLMTDVVVHVRDKNEMYCHKDILKFRSKWFYNAVCEADNKGVDVIEVDEDPRVLEAVLVYMYTGDLRLLQSQNLYLVEAYEAAVKYGFSRLEEIFKRMLRASKYREIMKYTEFRWLVEVDDGKILDTECPVLKNFSVCGNDKWNMKIKHTCSSDDIYDCGIEMYLERQTEEPCKTVHLVHLTIHVTDSNGEHRHFINDKNDFIVDGECSVNKHIPLTKLLKEYDNLISNGMLTLTCELTFWARINFLTKITLTDPYSKYIYNELVHLSEDMFNVFRDGRTHDVSISRCHVKMHNYVLLIRSRIPKYFIEELERRTGFRKLLWMSFASFLYTGQSRFLDEHARTVYCALSEMTLNAAAKRYSNFLARNLTLENAFCIMNDAVTYKDENLLLAAANFLASKSELESDPQAWIRIVSDKSNLLKFVNHSYTIFKQHL